MMRKLTPLHYLILLLPVTTVVATALLYRFGAPIWRWYVVYSLEMLTHPLIALFLFLTLITLATAIVLRYRHVSEMLAFCFLLSAVLHLLTVAFFSLWIVPQDVVEVDIGERRVAVSPGVPRRSEGMVGEALRSLLQEVEIDDALELDVHTETVRSAYEPAAHTPRQIAPPERTDRIKDRSNIAVEAEEAQQALDAVLAQLKSRMPVRDNSDVVQVEGIEPEPEESDPVLAPRVDKMTVEASASQRVSKEIGLQQPDAPSPEVKRDNDDLDSPEFASLQAKAQLVEDALEIMNREQPEATLPMPIRLDSAEVPTEEVIRDPSPESRDLKDPKRHVAQHDDAVPPLPTSGKPKIELPDASRASSLQSQAVMPDVPSRAQAIQDASQVSPEYRDRTVVDLAGSASKVQADPDEVQPPPSPDARQLTTDRMSAENSEAKEQVDIPAVALPETEQRPKQKSVAVSRVDATSERPQTDTSVQHLSAEMTMLPERVLSGTVSQMEASDEASAASPPTPRIERNVTPVRSKVSHANTALAEKPLQRHQTIPQIETSQKASLISTEDARMASPETRTAYASEPMVLTLASGQPDAVIVELGGRLMLVEASPREAQLEPAQLSVRDVVMAHHKQKREVEQAPEVSTDVLTLTPSKAERVTRESIRVSDSVRMISAKPKVRAEGTLAQTETATPSVTAFSPVVETMNTSMATSSVARTQKVADVRLFADAREMASHAKTDEPAAKPRSIDVRTPDRDVMPSPTLVATTSRVAVRLLEKPVATEKVEVEVNKTIDSIQSASPAIGVVARVVVDAGDPVDVKRDAPIGPQHIAVSPRKPEHAGAVGEDKYAESQPRLRPSAALPTETLRKEGWSVEAPAMEERKASVDAKAAKVDAHLPQHKPMSVIATHVGSAETPVEKAVDAARSGIRKPDAQALEVSRAKPATRELMVFEPGAPPPRTTFIGKPASKPTALASLERLRNSSAGSAPELTVSTQLQDVKSKGLYGAIIRNNESSSIGVTQLNEIDEEATVQTQMDSGRHSARERVFSVTRTEATSGREDGESSREYVRASLPQVERPERQRQRMTIALTKAGAESKDIDETVLRDPSDIIKSIVSAEVSASKASPSRKAIYQLRNPLTRRQYISELGGSVETESAVEQALQWLSSAQSDDGRWDVDDFKGAAECGGRGNQESADVGITGFTLLAFLGAGYTHMSGDHSETIDKAIKWIAAGMQPDGDIRRGGQMYDQAMATAALCEAISLTGDKKLIPTARKAVQFILDAQNPGAAWRYHPRTDNDTSVTGWQILALKSAELAGIEIPKQHYNWTEKWLNSVRTGKEGGLYLYRQGHAVTPVMTAEGWFCQLFMEEQSQTRGQQESTDYVMQHLPVWSQEIPGAINFYYWYYATLALHLSGSEAFDIWNEALTTALMQGRVTEGPGAGTWDPVSHVGVRGGRIYSTAVATLCLEVYYRFLPFYKQTKPRPAGLQ